MSRTDIDDLAEVASAESREVGRDLRQTMLSGIVLTIPFFITLFVLLWVVGLVSNALTPLVGLLSLFGPTSEMHAMLVEVIALALIVSVIFLVGMSAQHGPDTALFRRFETVMEDLPGIGSIYTSVDRMSDVMVEGDTDSFQDVKLVEFPVEDNYVLAFLTAEPPAAVEDAAGAGDLVTVFVPLAPNPVMGGHLVNVPTDSVADVDLTVEEGMQAVITTGMAIDSNAHPADD